MNAVLLTSHSGKKTQKFIQTLNKLHFNEIFIKDKLLLEQFKKHRSNSKQKLFLIENMNISNEKKGIFIINTVNINIKAIKLLMSEYKKNSIVTLIYYKEKIRNKNLINIDENYNAIHYSFKEKAKDCYTASELYICSQKILKKHFREIFESRDFFNFFYMNNYNIYCIPYSICKKKQEEKKIAFLDRDGVLINTIGFPHKKHHLEINENFIPVLNKLKAHGYEFIIITNQSGIARGIFNIKHYFEFHNHVVNEFQKIDIKILDMFFCPYLENGKIKRYNKDSLLRKPKPGMILRALSKYNIDIYKSFMIGDKQSDKIMLPYLSSYLIQGNYKIDKRLKVCKNFEDIYNCIYNEKIKN
ncbi:MAG: HAD-IIIA family hydrolase [Spirochaetes bacterium]|nr:HAD-IIIA family hydrolase [Spirochaetota bacterium]